MIVGRCRMSERVDVSPEMVAFVGKGSAERIARSSGSVVLVFQVGSSLFSVNRELPLCDLVLVVDEAACLRIFGFVPGSEGGSWHMPNPMRAIAIALRDCPLAEPARTTLRLAKSIELLCAAFGALRENDLVPTAGVGEWSEVDTRRIIAAHRMIDERWSEKLTVEAIARACGLNRTKLNRGFRSMFDCTVGSAIAEHRLAAAREMLLATNLPVASIGYQCGYLNNASFARAFARRFGEAPSQMRAHLVAA